LGSNLEKILITLALQGGDTVNCLAGLESAKTLLRMGFACPPVIGRMVLLGVLSTDNPEPGWAGRGDFRPGPQAEQR